MALITCKECGQTISDKAKSCPNCGCPVGDYQGQNAQNNIPNETNCNNSGNVIGTKKYSVTIPMIIGIVTYIVLTILLCNVGGNSDIEVAINTCAIIGTIVALCIAKSNVDRLIYIIVNVIIAVIAHKFWKELLYGTAVVVFVTNISVIVVSALKRNKPTSINKKVDLYATWLFRLLPTALLTLYNIAVIYHNIIFFIKVGRDVYITNLIFSFIPLLINFCLAYWICKKFITDKRTRKRSFAIIASVIAIITFISLLVLSL